MRTAGGFFLASAAFLAAVQVIRGKKLRLETLRQLCGALELTQGELSVRNAAIPEILELLTGRTTGESRAFFAACRKGLDRLDAEDFAGIWRRAADEALHSLKEPEREELRHLGEVLGRYDLETQMGELRRVTHMLRQNLEREERDYPAERRLILTLGASAGLLIVIVLL